MPKEGVPFIFFLATRDITKDEEILYDYCDYSKSSKQTFHGLNIKDSQKFVKTNKR